MAGTFTGQPLVQAAFPTSNGTLGTVPTLTTWRISHVGVCNTDTADHTFRLYFVPPAGSIGVANVQFYDFPIPAKTSLPLGFNAYLAAGATIQGQSDSVLVGLSVFGVAET
jgi:hypothetical protein